MSHEFPSQWANPDGGTRHGRLVLSRPWPLIMALLAVLVALACFIIFLPYGYQAYDDEKYLDAALKWLAEGVHAADTHWATRLPYVIAQAAFLQLFGTGEPALVLLHSLFFLGVAFAVWGLGSFLFGPVAGLFAVLVACATPMVMRLPTFYRIEGAEMALVGLCCYIVVRRWDEMAKRRLVWLLAAGVLGGLAFSIRQTALAIPAALALLLLMDQSRPAAQRVAAVAALAAGYALPVLAEVIFNTLVTGDPTHRLKVDLRHVTIPSAHMRGGVYQGSGGTLFNWEIAASWIKLGPLDVHWTVNPLINVLASPWLLLLPWFGLLGAWFALRDGDTASRRFAYLAFLVLGLQYLLNTFMFVVPPTIRYYQAGLVLFCPLAALALVRLVSGLFRTFLLWAIFFAVPGLTILMISPGPSASLPVVERFARSHGPLHVTPQLRATARFLFWEQPDLNDLLLPGEPPVDGLTLAVPLAPPSGGFQARCEDGGQPRWTLVARSAPESLPWQVIEATGVGHLVPRALAAALRRDAVAVSLLRRNC